MPKKYKPFDLERVLACLSYNPETGDLTWLDGVGNSMSGKTAGSVWSDGYRYLRLGRKVLLAHRVAWMLCHGVRLSSDQQIDHINMCRSDNRICNLRLATLTQNNINRRISPKNTTGFKGVKRTSNGKFAASIGHMRKVYSLGTFDTPEAAHAAYTAKGKELHGEFFRAS